MTEAELVEALTSYHDLLFNVLSIYLTVTSGYLAVAYVVGDKLTTHQVVVISVLYLFFALVSTWGAFGYAMRGIDYVEPLQVLNPDQMYYGHPAAAALTALLLLGGILASLSFMWSIRHPRSK
jgi:hypothetical protein